MAIHLHSAWTHRLPQAVLAGAGLMLLPVNWARAGAAAGAPGGVTTAPAVRPPAPVLPPLPQVAPPPLPEGTATPVPTTRPISVQEAVTIALANQPQVGIASSSVAAAAGRTRQATSAYAPAVSISAARTHSGASGPATGPSVSGGAYTTSVSGSQLLYDFGRTPAQIAQARRQQEAAQQGLAQTRQDVVNQVKQAYYTLLQDQQLVGVQRSNVADQQAHLDLTRARFGAGVAPRSDVVRAETAVASALFDLANAENAAAVARVNLNSAMGVDVRTPTVVQESVEPVPPGADAADLVALAFSRRPDIAQFRASVNAAEEAVKVAETTDKPDLFLDASYGLRGSDFPPEARNWSYGVALSWPIFSGGLTRGRVEEARANLQAARENLRQGELTVGADVVQAYLSVQTAEQNVTAAAAEVANAEESVAAATGRYEAGVATYVEVIDAQAALLTAQTNRVNAAYGLSLARAALARALGTEGL